MTTWSEILRSTLGVTWSTSAVVPFGIPSTDLSLGPGAGSPVRDPWHVDAFVERDGDWVLSSHTRRGLEATCTFRLFPDTRAVEVWGKVVHRGTEPVPDVFESLVLDLPLTLGPGFDRPWVRTVNGISFHPTSFPPEDFAVNDRQMLGAQMMESIVRIEGGDGGRSSDRLLPVAIVGDERGTAGFALMLEWSGTWTIRLHHHAWGEDGVRHPQDLRVRAGIRGLDLELRPGQALPLPRVLLTAFDGDLEAGGNAVRRHIRRHVTPTIGGLPPLPAVYYNSFWAHEENVSAEILTPDVDAAAAAGIEYFVVDAGWFEGGLRAATPPSWEEDRAKFPDGIAAFADYVRSTGMQYGTWFEPEDVPLTHQLFREHPEWFWTTETGFHPGARRASRSALINLSIPEARAWWVARIVRAYTEWGVRWIRWDFNLDPRTYWESGVPAGELGWRQIQHIQGFYRTVDEILAACPDLHIEQCASGGYRIDLGTIRRGHSFWMNDVAENSDLNRAFQHGLNTVLPGNYGNTHLFKAHFRPDYDFDEYEFLSQSAGGFGISGPFWKATPEGFRALTDAIARFTSFRHLLLGDYARPTGQPRRADEYAKVVFSDGGESVTMEFNHDGPGTARFRVLQA